MPLARPRPLAPGADTVVLSSQAVLLQTRAAATMTLALRWKPAWRVLGAACVSRAPEGRVRLTVTEPGQVVLQTAFSLPEGDTRCG